MASHGISHSEYTAQSRDEHLRARELKRIVEYNELNDRVMERRSVNDHTPEALLLTSQLLKLNPEFYTIWNYRRQILQHTLFAAAPSDSDSDSNSDYAATLTHHLNTELNFLLPILSTHPKCYWLWNHRLWTLHQSGSLGPTLSSPFWHSELRLVAQLLQRDVRNFHGWLYRRTILAHTPPVVATEFAYTTTMLQRAGGLRNYSAWHNRSTLIPALLSGRGTQARMDFLEDELAVLRRAVATEPADGALWVYQRWLLVGGGADAVVPGMRVRVRVLMLREEVDGLRELVEGGAEGKGVLKALVEYVGLLQRLRREVREEVEAREAREQVDDDNEEEEEDVEDEEDVDEERERREMRAWLGRLMLIDPMRAGRYRDLATSAEIALQA